MSIACGVVGFGLSETFELGLWLRPTIVGIVNAVAMFFRDQHQRERMRYILYLSNGY